MPLKDWFKDFRKSGSTNLNSSNNNIEQSVHGGQQFLLVNDCLEVVQPKRALLPPHVDLTVSCPVHRYSRLKPTLADVFKEKDTLSAFIQYMDAHKIGHLVRFCLEADAFASFYNAPVSNSFTAILGRSDTARAGEKEDAESVKMKMNQGGDEKNVIADGDKRDEEKMDNCLEDKAETEEKIEEGAEQKKENAEEEGCAGLDQNLEPKQCDALAIYHRFLAPESSSIIPVPDDLRNAAIKNICSDCGDIPGDAFRPCREFVLRIIEESHFPSFLRSEHFCRWQIDFLTNRRATLADFLYHESAMFYLREFMENEDLTELLVFVLAVDTYRSLIADPKCTRSQAMEYAMDIYDKYFSLQATSPLGFDDSIRMEVECSICRDEGPDPESYERARQIVLQFIEKNYLPVFLNSQLFYKYLGELVYTVQTSDIGYIPRMRPRRLASDSESLSALLSPTASSSQAETSSVHSEPISSRNTLLAGATSQGRSLRRALDRVAGGELRISEPLSGLNTAWSRGVRQALSPVGTSEGRSTGGSSNGSMSLGHIDELGTFHSEIEQIQADSSLLSSVFKKNKDRKQAEEDMALRIAKMVIQDVQELTCTAQADSGDS